jgi:hypothetical protein
MDTTLYVIEIPHQRRAAAYKTTWYTLAGDAAADQYYLDHEKPADVTNLEWAREVLFHDLHSHMIFRNLIACRTWAKRYSGHQQCEVRSAVRELCW